MLTVINVFFVIAWQRMMIYWKLECWWGESF